jgi:aspartyl/asparaginyl-tRNA synthetase
VTFKPVSAVPLCGYCCQKTSLGGSEPLHVGQQVEVRGWLRTVRQQKQFAFMQVSCCRRM